MKQSPWTGTRYISGPKIPVILWSPKVHDRIHISSPLSLILIQMNPIYATHPFSLRSNLILSSHLSLDLPSCPFPIRFPTKTLYSFLFSHTRTTHMAHLICRFWSSEYIPEQVRNSAFSSQLDHLNSCVALSSTSFYSSLVYGWLKCTLICVF